MMDLAHRIRIIFAAAIAVAAAGVIHVADGVAGGGPLVPDLTTLRPIGSPWLDLTKTKKKLVLHLSNRIGNHGSGPLDLYAGPVDATCQGQYDGADLEADQRIFVDKGPPGFDPGDEPGPGQKVGCFEYHPTHGHWHFQDFAQYSLVDVGTDELVAGPSKKIGFCILDGDQAYPELPGTPDVGHYPGGGNGCGQGAPETGPSSMGLSVGYADTYSYFLPGQRLEVTGIEKGVYCLVSTANPDHGAGDTTQLIESDDTNNSRRERIRINPAVAKVVDLDRACPAP